MKDSETEACFGCLNISCKKRLDPKKEPLSPGGFLRSLPALLIPAAGFIAGFALPAVLVSGATEALQAACGMTALFVSAWAWYRFRRNNQSQK
ncbi:MAG: hypothetical protein LBR96_02650 [Treponema sp.]|jgi:hypothetical protein|nr:hypothetical protein [Treponema sp.]